MGASFFGVLIITLAESNRYFLLVLGRARRRTAIILSRDVNDWGRTQTAISVTPRWGGTGSVAGGGSHDNHGHHRPTS